MCVLLLVVLQRRQLKLYRHFMNNVAKVLGSEDPNSDNVMKWRAMLAEMPAKDTASCLSQMDVSNAQSHTMNDFSKHCF